MSDEMPEGVRQTFIETIHWLKDVASHEPEDHPSNRILRFLMGPFQQVARVLAHDAEFGPTSEPGPHDYDTLDGFRDLGSHMKEISAWIQSTLKAGGEGAFRAAVLSEALRYGLKLVINCADLALERHEK